MILFFMNLFKRYQRYCDSLWYEAPPWAVELKCLTGLILSNQKNILMPAIDDLKAALADLATELADNNTEIEALLAKIATPGVTDSEIAAAVVQIRGLIADNKAEVDKAKAA